MSRTLTYQGIENVQLRHHHVGRGIRLFSPYAPAPIWAHAPALAHAHAHAPTPAHSHSNVTAPHLPLHMHMQTNPHTHMPMQPHRTRSIVRRALPASSTKWQSCRGGVLSWMTW
ncbi:hypothetical protein O181_115829 [Austropuccinia psidii MF-1]|uniref:Uncharacterized protein n=1 Tax=Austropuccinia psidii MF-1 TaxID=1389203 RepID=A0A9Q3KAC3_9BASI|nr:hypothetical protein [Austropuccinia psidii MF-1]